MARALVGIHDSEASRLADQPVPGRRFVEQLRPLRHMTRPDSRFLLVGGHDHVQRRSEVAGAETGGGANRCGQRPLHVGGAAAIQLAAVDAGLVRVTHPAVLFGPRHGVVVAEQRQAADAIAELADDTRLVDPVAIAIRDGLDVELERAQQTADVVSHWNVALATGRSVVYELSGDVDDVHFHGDRTFSVGWSGTGGETRGESNIGRCNWDRKTPTPERHRCSLSGVQPMWKRR